MLDHTHHHKPRKDDKDFSDRKQRIYDFLFEHPVGVLSSVTPDSRPHGSVIYYAVNTDFELTFLTKADTRKYDNLTHDYHVMLTVFEPQSQTTAQITGKATEITDGYAINTVAGDMLGASMRTSDPGVPPISKLEAGSYVAFQIHPFQIRMAVYARPDPGEYTQIFESIESFELNDND